MFLAVEAEDSHAAARMAEEIARLAFPSDASIQAKLVYDADGNVSEPDSANPS
jgi:hypothetical protein